MIGCFRSSIKMSEPHGSLFYRRLIAAYPNGIIWAFNIFLVSEGIRTATLIEALNPPALLQAVTAAASHRGARTRRNRLPIFERLPDHVRIFECPQGPGTGSTDTQPSLIVYDSRQYNETDVRRMSASEAQLGRLLGFQCAGELGGRYTLRFLVSIGGGPLYNFYSEACAGAVNKELATRRFAGIEAAADLFSAIVGCTVRVNMAIIDTVYETRRWIMMISNPKSGDDAFLNRDSLADILDSFYMGQSAQYIRAASSSEEFTEFLDDFGSVLVFMLCLSISPNNPEDGEKEFYNISLMTQEQLDEESSKQRRLGDMMARMSAKYARITTAEMSAASGNGRSLAGPSVV